MIKKFIGENIWLRGIKLKFRLRFISIVIIFVVFFFFSFFLIEFFDEKVRVKFFDWIIVVNLFWEKGK